MPWSRTSRHSRGYGHQWDKLRAHILLRDKYLCQPCLAKGHVHPATEVDHIISKAKGGTDDEDNLQAIASECHKAKTTGENGGTYRPKVRYGPDGWPTQAR